MKKDEIIFESNGLHKEKATCKNNTLEKFLNKKFLIILLIVIILSAAFYYAFNYFYRDSSPAFYIAGNAGSLKRVIKGKQLEILMDKDYMIGFIELVPNSSDVYFIAYNNVDTNATPSASLFYANNNSRPRKVLDLAASTRISTNSDNSLWGILDKDTGVYTIYSIKKDKAKILFENIKDLVFLKDDTTIMYINDSDSLIKFADGRQQILAENVKNLCPTDGKAGSFVDKENRLFTYDGTKLTKIDDNIVNVYSTEKYPLNIFYTARTGEGRPLFYFSKAGQEKTLIIDNAPLELCLVDDGQGVVFLVPERTLYYFNGMELKVIAEKCNSMKMLRYDYSVISSQQSVLLSPRAQLIYEADNKLYYYSGSESRLLMDYGDEYKLGIPKAVGKSNNVFYYVLEGSLYSIDLDDSSSQPRIIDQNVVDLLAPNEVYYGYITRKPESGNFVTNIIQEDGNYISINGFIDDNLFTQFHDDFIGFAVSSPLSNQDHINFSTGSLYYFNKNMAPHLIATDALINWQAITGNVVSTNSKYFFYVKMLDETYGKYELYASDGKESFLVWGEI